MLGIFQNRIYFAILILVTTIIAVGIAYRGLDLGFSPRTYAEIIATPTPTRGPDTPTPAPRPLPPPTRILPPTFPLVFSDNFTDTRNFTLVPNIGARVSVTNSSLLVRLTQPTTAVLLSQSSPARGTDLAIMVDVRSVALVHGEYGLLFWHGMDSKTRSEAFVYFLINPAGSFRVTLRNNQDKETEIVPRLVSSEISPGTLVNHLQVDGRGNRLTFLVNGSVIANVANETLQSFRAGLVPDGKVGLIARSEVVNLDVQFSNFRLYAQP